MKKQHKYKSKAIPAQPTPRQEEIKPITKSDAIEPAKEEMGGILDDFDLRKAIIYAEILKPKFDE